VWIDLRQGDIAEQDLKNCINSPEGMLGVEGLTHDHLVEISAGVYMKFKHAYAVGQVSDQAVELLDPHGDNIADGKSEKQYSPDLAKQVQDFLDHLEQLEQEIKASNYTSFSLKTFENIDLFIDFIAKRKDVNIDQKDKAIIEEINKNWKRLANRNKLTEVNGNLTGLRAKNAENILGVLIKKKKEFALSNLSTGQK
jgi:hypothetical protein